jgi:N-acetylmuramoyl-L-alanine amidase
VVPGVFLLRRVACCLLLAVAHGTPLPPATSGALSANAATAVATVLASEPAAGVRLLSASLEGDRLTLDFSRELLALGPGSLAFEQFSRRVHRAAAEVLQEALAHFEIHTQIDGVPLPKWLPPTESAARSRPLLAPPGSATPGTNALTSRRVAVSPGHGYYLNGTNWVLQRGYWQGIVEDFVNHDMITLVRDELAGAGATVIPTRNLDRTAGTGESGFPKWQEAARYHVKAVGADTSVWNESGYTHLEQDIRCRPRYANSVGADVLVSLHNNGGGGTGTETLYDTNNGFGTESRRLADAVHNRVIATLRREYNPAWPDRRVQGFNGSYGENRLATRPSILIEVAFMDRPTPDNAALQDEAFKRLVARAIREGVQEYFDGPAGVPPYGPASLIATLTPTAVSLAWLDQSANETGFRIERRAEGATTWEVVGTAAANVTAYVDTAPVAGRSSAYRVAAFNAAGPSALYSNEATLVASPAPPVTTPAVPAAWLSNVSLRTTLGSAQAVTVGFVVAGGSREILVRAGGPTLTQFGLVTAMADPRLELFRGAARVTDNNDWPAALAPTMAALGAFPFSPNSRDAALFRSLDGAHTVQATGTTAGTILVEAYDLGGGGTGRLVNLSARQRVGTGADILIAGFYIAGTGEKRVLIRAVGPALASFGVTGVLADPRLEVFDGTRSIAANDNWDSSLAPTFGSVAAFALPAGSRDAALVLNLAAGRSYTAQVAGAGTSTGEALVEVYELP